MRHQVKGKKLNRSTPHRKATLQALAVALVKEQRIQTTLAKAKELRRFVEPLITRAKTDTTHNRRLVFAALQDKYSVTELFEEVGPAAADRPGGYTRVLKLGHRLGDAAELAVIELVDFNDVKPETRSGGKKRTRRAGKSNKPVSPDTSDGKQKKKVQKAEKSEEKAEEKTEGKKKTAKKAKASKKEASNEESEEKAKSKGSSEDKEEK